MFSLYLILFPLYFSLLTLLFRISNSLLLFSQGHKTPVLQRWVAVEAALAKAYIPLWFTINTIRAEVLNSETLLLYWPSPFKEVPVLRVDLSLV